MFGIRFILIFFINYFFPTVKTKYRAATPQIQSEPIIVVTVVHKNMVMIGGLF